MKNNIVIVGTLGDERMEFVIPDTEPRIHSHIRHMIEEKKDFETLQTLVSKNVILSKFGNMYKNLELLKAHNNIKQYTFTVDFA